MNTRSLPRFTAITALALAAMVTATACTSAGPPKPTPATSGSASPSVAVPAPAASLPGNPKPEPVVLPRTTRPAAASACLGAVVRSVDASDTGPPWKRLCLTVGGVLRVTNLGPEGFSANPSDKVECNYAAGVRECRLLHTGTVTFTITNAHQTRTLTLVIVKATSPPKPSPACLAAGTMLTIDAADGGPSPRAVCVRMSTVVRVVHLGPDEFFQVRPAGAVTCFYEAAVRECRFTQPQTVTFTTRIGDSEPRTQTVVVIR